MRRDEKRRIVEQCAQFIEARGRLCEEKADGSVLGITMRRIFEDEARYMRAMFPDLYPEIAAALRECERQEGN